MPENIHSEFQVNRMIFQDGGIWGGYFPPQGGTGGNEGEFRKTDRTLTLVMRQRTYIPSFKTIKVNFEILKFRGEVPPLGGGNGGEFRKTETGIR